MNLDIKKERMEYLDFAPEPLPGYWCERQEREFAVWCAAKARATPSPAPIQQERQDACIPPSRAEPAGQHDAGGSVLTDARITEISRAFRNANGTLLMDLSFARAIEAELASRSRAQGGNTNPCKVCNGEGGIHTGIDENPTTECRKCDGSGLAPTVKASQSDTHPSATARNEKD